MAAFFCFQLVIGGRNTPEIHHGITAQPRIVATLGCIRPSIQHVRGDGNTPFGLEALDMI